jgi:hypothetical protein
MRLDSIVGLSNRNNTLNRAVKAWISENNLQFDLSSDTVGAKLLSALEKETVVKAFSLKRHPLQVEHVQTFLYRALFFLLEFDSTSTPPRKPTQKQSRQLNEIRFNVSSPPVIAPLTQVPFAFFQHEDIVDLIKNKIGQTLSSSSSANSIASSSIRKFSEETTPKNTKDSHVDDEQRLLFLKSLQPAQLNLFKIFMK